MRYRFRHPLPTGLVVRHLTHEWPGAHEGTARIAGADVQNQAQDWFYYTVRLLEHVHHGDRTQRWHSTHVAVPDAEIERCGHIDADPVKVIGWDDEIPVCPACGVLMCQWVRQTAQQTLETPAEYTDPCERPGTHELGDDLLCDEHLAEARREEAEADRQYRAEMAQVLDELRYGDPLHRGQPDDPDLPMY